MRFEPDPSSRMSSQPLDPPFDSPSASREPPLPDDPDAPLLLAVSEGDREALAALYDRFSRPLYAVAHRILGDPDEAEDIVHDAFVSVWARAGDYQPSRGAAFSWLVSLVRNRAIDRLRSRRRRREILDTAVSADLETFTTREEPDSAARLGLQENAHIVRRAIASLAPDQRSALELAFFGGLTQPEIAARLQAPLGTVKARIRRGLLKLRDTLAPRP